MPALPGVLEGVFDLGCPAGEPKEAPCAWLPAEELLSKRVRTGSLVVRSLGRGWEEVGFDGGPLGVFFLAPHEDPGLKRPHRQAIRSAKTVFFRMG